MEAPGEPAGAIPFPEASGTWGLDIADWEPCAIQDAISAPVRRRLPIRTAAPFRRNLGEAFTVCKGDAIGRDRSDLPGLVGLKNMVSDHTLQWFGMYDSVSSVGYVRPGPPIETPTNQELPSSPSHSNGKRPFWERPEIASPKAIRIRIPTHKRTSAVPKFRCDGSSESR